tara:strand:- start:41 stop:280 length:240 start_codon:yes stop_codon:yes gene_type:complete
MKVKTFEEISQHLTESGDPICKERVRQIHDKALEKIRHALNVPENHEIRDDFAEVVDSSGETATSYRVVVEEGKIYEPR